MSKVLFYYSAIASFVITASLVLTSNSITPVVFAVLFLPVAAYFVSEFFHQMRSIFSPKEEKPYTDVFLKPRKGEIFAMAVIFLIFLGIGIRNVSANAKAAVQGPATPTPTPSLIFSTDQTPSPAPASLVIISITDGSAEVNIRSKPTIYSDKAGSAKDGDRFEMISESAGWYQIKLPDGSTGYISGNYIKQQK